MKNKDKGRLPPFVPLLKDTLDSPAWRAMSHGARVLYIALRRRYNMQAHNNGRLYLSQRKAVEEIGSSTNQVTRWYRELQHYGFIVMTTPGGLGVYGKGKAPCWRLTEIGFMKDPPTRDFERWNGVRFSKHQPGGDTHESGQSKTESRSGKGGHTVAEKGDTTVAEKGDTSWNKCSGKGGHTAGLPVAEKGDKSSIPLGGWDRGLSKDQRETLKLPLMTALDGGKLPWSTPQVVEVPGRQCAHCGGNGEIFQYKNGRRPVWLHRRCRHYWLHAHGAAS